MGSKKRGQRNGVREMGSERHDGDDLPFGAPTHVGGNFEAEDAIVEELDGGLDAEEDEEEGEEGVPRPVPVDEALVQSGSLYIEEPREDRHDGEDSEDMPGVENVSQSDR